MVPSLTVTVRSQENAIVSRASFVMRIEKLQHSEVQYILVCSQIFLALLNAFYQSMSPSSPYRIFSVVFLLAAKLFNHLEFVVELWRPPWLQSLLSRYLQLPWKLKIFPSNVL